MKRRRLLLKSIAISLCCGFALFAVACGDDDGAGGSVSPTPATTQASADATAGASPQSSPAPTPATAPTLNATAQAFLDLATLTLRAEDVPDGFSIRSNQPLTREQVSSGLRALPSLSAFVQASSVDGGWASFYTADNPPAALSSIVLRFATPADAQAMVAQVASLTTREYPGAQQVDRAPSDKIEDAAQLMRYTLQGARSLEYSWAQGRLFGQIVLRYAGEFEGPNDPALLTTLARKQADRMRAYTQ